PTVSLSRTFFTSGQRRFLQYSESSELRCSDQLFDVATVRRSHTNAEQLPRRRGTEWRTPPAVPDRGAALDGVGAQDAVLIFVKRESSQNEAAVEKGVVGSHHASPEISIGWANYFAATQRRLKSSVQPADVSSPPVEPASPMPRRRGLDPRS